MSEQTADASRPTLYIMCGLPFAGKSTIAGRLAKRLGAALISVDDIKTEHGLRNVWKEMKAKDWESIFAEAKGRAARALGEGRDVIYDSANHTKASRADWRALAEASGANLKIVFLENSPDEVRRRWLENKARETRMDLPDWAFDRALEDYEPPIGEEGVVRPADLGLEHKGRAP